MHVGIFVKFGGVKFVTHFTHSNTISEYPLGDSRLDTYEFLFLPKDFNLFIYSIVPFLRDLSLKKFTHLNLNTDSVIYKDGKFVTVWGVNYGAHQVDSLLEGIINCAIFVLTVFNSFRIRLIKTEEFPPICSLAKKFYLDDWLNAQNITEKEEYRRYHIELRGKHVFYVPIASSIPVSYAELQSETDKLVEQLFVKYSTP